MAAHAKICISTAAALFGHATQPALAQPPTDQFSWMSFVFELEPIRIARIGPDIRTPISTPASRCALWASEVDVYCHVRRRCANGGWIAQWKEIIDAPIQRFRSPASAVYRRNAYVALDERR